MSNPIKREYDKLSLAKDIVERENIVYQFQTTGFLDRNNAIEKIKTTQLTDADLALATITKQAISGSAGVIDEKSLRTWDSEDVLAVYDSLVRAHESINKLALVPESF